MTAAGSARACGTMNAFWNAGDAPARALEIISPAGFERYFAEIAPLLPPARPSDSEPRCPTTVDSSTDRRCGLLDVLHPRLPAPGDEVLDQGDRVPQYRRASKIGTEHPDRILQARGLGAPIVTEEP